ncbi:MAG: TetR/AcrR family transcriptional regulator C-terminal domain-containing protein [Oscillospiraceae bacterium]|nr:TetR/AcrR family transcriptional regulator C-terminal domain-containing protein [Oscillospiraceae bacterium]
MAQRENQRVVISKRLLKEGLLRMLEHQSLEEVNVSALCRESGINRATFYRHFTCPRDVLVDLEMDMMRELGKTLKKPTSVAEAQQYLQEICEYLYVHKDLVRVLIRCKTDEDLVGVLRECNQRVCDLRGEFRHIGQLDPDCLRLISTFMYSGGYYLIRQWLTEDIHKTPAEVAQLLYGLIISRDRPVAMN